MTPARRRLGPLLGIPLMAGMALAMATGCERGAPDGPRAWFEAATGVKLPETATVRNSKCITVAFVGDTYYIELSASPELEATLREHFRPEAVPPDDLDPPADWLDEMPFWRPQDLPTPCWFTKTSPADGELEWSCAVAYDRGAGKCFFVGAECR